jgi:hypothetical protein
MLVAEGVPNLDAACQHQFGRLAEQRAEVDHQDLSEIDTNDQGALAAFVPAQDVAVAQHGAAL